MSERWQIRRGTTTENNQFTGAQGELTMDTQKKQLRVHDGSTQGGAGIIDPVVAFQTPNSGNNYTWYRKYASGWVEQGGQFAQSGDGVAITFPVTMANANYSVVGGILDNSGAQGWRYANRTTTGFTKNLVGSTQCGGSWEVRGMAA